MFHEMRLVVHSTAGSNLQAVGGSVMQPPSAGLIVAKIDNTVLTCSIWQNPLLPRQEDLGAWTINRLLAITGQSTH